MRCGAVRCGEDTGVEKGTTAGRSDEGRRQQAPWPARSLSWSSHSLTHLLVLLDGVVIQVLGRRARGQGRRVAVAVPLPTATPRTHTGMGSTGEREEEDCGHTTVAACEHLPGECVLDG